MKEGESGGGRQWLVVIVRLCSSPSKSLGAKYCTVAWGSAVGLTTMLR